MNESGVIQIVLKGKENNQVPLLAVADTFKEFHQIVDKSYLSITGKNKLHKNDREFYKIVATNIRSGSVIAELSIVLPPLLQSAFYFHSTGLSSLTVNNIWELAKNSFKFLEHYASAKNNGKKVVVNQHNNPYGLNVINQEGSHLTINVGTLVQQTASRSEANIKSLAKIIDDKNIVSFSALDETENGIILTSKENRLFNPETVMDKNPVELIAKIFRLDIENKSGKMRVLRDAYQGEYSFKIIGKQKISPYIHALEKEYSELTALKEIIMHPSGDETLAGFHIIGIN